MEHDTIRTYQNVPKVVKDIPQTFARIAKISKGGSHPRDSVPVQKKKIDKLPSISSSLSSDTHVTVVADTPPNRQSIVHIDEVVTFAGMPCSKQTAAQQQSLHVGHHKANFLPMTNKTQKTFAKLAALSNPLLQGFSSGDCDKTRKTDLSTTLSFPNKGHLQQQQSLNYDVGHVFGDLSATQSGGAIPNQTASNTDNSSNNLFFRTSHSTLQVPENTTGVRQSSLDTYSSSFADISHRTAGESIKNNNFYDHSNTQNVNCKMILSGTGRETCAPSTLSPAQPVTSDQSIISTGENPKPNLPSMSNPCRSETNFKPSMVTTDPERLALIKQRKRERKFRKLQSLSALMRAPDDRHSTVTLSTMRRDRLEHENRKQESLKQESIKQESVKYPSDSTVSSKFGDFTQNPFNWMSSTATVGVDVNSDKKPWHADTVRKTCSFFHEPSLRNNTILSENFLEMPKNRADYKTEKKLNDSGSNSWQLHDLHSSNSLVVDDALQIAALKHIKSESPLDEQLLPSASGKLSDISTGNKIILENFLTPRVKKEDSGSESSSAMSSEEENSLSPKIKGLGCKDKAWGSRSKKRRSPSKFGNNVDRFKNGQTDCSASDQFRPALGNNYQKHSADYKVSEEVDSDKSIYAEDDMLEDETDDDSDNSISNNYNNNSNDNNNKKKKKKLFGTSKRKSSKIGTKRRGRPPLSESHKTAKRRGRPPLASNSGKSEAPTKPAKLEKPAMESDTKDPMKVRDDTATAESKVPKRRGRPPKKLATVAPPSSPHSPPTSVDPATASADVHIASVDALAPVDTLTPVNASADAPTTPPPLPPPELTSEEILKARLNLPRRRGRPSKVDVMLREIAAAHLAARQPLALPSPEEVAAALAQSTVEVPAAKKKMYARRRYHAYGQRRRKCRKTNAGNLLRMLSRRTTESDAEEELGGLLPPSSRGEEEEEGSSRVEEDEEEDDEEEVEEKTEVCGSDGTYSDGGTTAGEEEEDEAFTDKRHHTDRHHPQKQQHRRHHQHHHHRQEQQKQEHQRHNNNINNVNPHHHHHHQLPLSSSSSASSPLSSSSPLSLPSSSSSIVVSLSQLPHHSAQTGKKPKVEAPDAKKKRRKRKKDADGEAEVKKRRRSGEPVSGTSVNNNNNNVSVEEVAEEEEEAVLIANGNSFRCRVTVLKTKRNGSTKGPATTFTDLEGLKKEVGEGEENKEATPPCIAERPKSKNKKTPPSSSFSSSSTKAGVIKISRNNNKSKINNSSSSSSSSTSTAPTVGSATRQIVPPVYNVPRVMLPPCIKDDGIACLMCGRVHTQDHFFKYMELKSTETSHRCPLCGQFFSWSCLFIEHMRGHPENTAQYRCEYCGSVSRKISSYFNCRITHCPPSQEWFDLQKACDDYLANLENKSSSAAAKKRRKAVSLLSSPSSSSKKKRGVNINQASGGGGRGRKKSSVKQQQQEKDVASASVEKTQSASQLLHQRNNSGGNDDCSSKSVNDSNKRKGQKRTKGRKSSTTMKAPPKSTKPYECNVCQKTFLNFKFFTKHKELHKTETAHWCKECNKQFATLTCLNEHKRSHNTTEGAIEMVDLVCGDSSSEGIGVAGDNSNSCSSESNFKCRVCGALFPDAITYNSHTDLCSGLANSKQCRRLLGPHKCTTCERSFKFKQSLQNHMRRHTGERPFVCELCGKSFMLAGNLERHRRTHERDAASHSGPVRAKSNNKLFTCKHCDKVFTVEATYQSHLKVHDEDSQQLHCPYCDKHFLSRHMLKLHKRTHNEHRPFKCNMCSRCYKHKHSLIEHQHNCR